MVLPASAPTTISNSAAEMVMNSEPMAATKASAIHSADVSQTLSMRRSSPFVPERTACATAGHEEALPRLVSGRGHQLLRAVSGNPIPIGARNVLGRAQLARAAHQIGAPAPSLTRGDPSGPA